MVTLEDVLRDYFGCAKPFNKSGKLSYRGAKTYNKMVALLYSIGKLTDTDTNGMVETLDHIANEKPY